MTAEPSLLRTPLHDLHVALGAKMVPFAGYDMPVQFPDGVKAEHLHTRSRAGLFDVSHMGQVSVRGDDAAAALESLMPANVIDLPPGRQRYGLLTNDAGGIRDDLMVTRREHDFLVVVNAACKAADLAWMQEAIGSRCDIELLTDRALLALQGPAAVDVISRLAPGIATLQFMDTGSFELDGAPCYVSRSGYTGEDGVEISVPAAAAEGLARALLDFDEVEPIGLGARDSLRLEAGLCLYGHDIDAGTSPVEANLAWAIGKARRRGGSRAGGFPGAAVILDQLEAGTTRRRMGVRALGRAPVREGAELVDAGGETVGLVTSGGFGPSVDGPVAMGYVNAAHAQPGTRIAARVRNREIEVEITSPVFVEPHYAR